MSLGIVKHGKKSTSYTTKKTPSVFAHSDKHSVYKDLFSCASAGNHELIDIPAQVLPVLCYFSPHPIALIIIGGTMMALNNLVK